LIEVKNNNLFLTLVIKMYILKICLLVGLLGVRGLCVSTIIYT
jgi:hypothetical protein